MIRTVFLATGVLFAATACVTPSQEQLEADVDVAASGALPEISEGWQTASSDGAVQVGWIEGFNDAQLTALVAEAQLNNLNLVQAAAAVDQARALARQAGASLLPELTGSLGGTEAGQLGGSSSGSTALNAGVQVGWELDLWGRIRSGVAQATASAEAAEADYRFAQYSVAANTAIAYFIAIEANAQIAIARDSLGALEQTGRIVEIQYGEGMVSAQDLALSNSDLAVARDQVVSLEGAFRDALRALELLLGRYPSADISLREALPPVPAAPPAGVPSGVLERRPDLVSAEREVAAAFNAVNQARAAQLPSISLTGTLGGSSNQLSSLLDSGNVAWSAGANLLAPIFDGGRLRENVTIATSQQEAALARYADAALQAFSDVETSLDQGQVLAQRQTILHEAAGQAAEAYRIAGLRYEEGEISLIDLLSVQQRTISTRSTLLSVERLLLEQRVNLNLALGGDWN